MILTLVVFGAAVLLWVCTPLDDTFVALAAVAALLLFGVLPASSLAALGGATTWLLLAAFVLAAGVTASGLTTRLATWLVSRARTVRGLAHLAALALLLTAFFVPSTSGRAALTLPVYAELRGRLNDRVARAFGVLFPSVILLTAVATLVGAGAHLITSSLLESAGGQGIGFGRWLLLGVPLAVVSAHVTAEIVLWLFTTGQDRATPLHAEDADDQGVGERAAGEQGTVEVPALAGALPTRGGALPAQDGALPTRGGALPTRGGALPAHGGAARSEGPLQGVPCSNSPTRHRQFRTLELTPGQTSPQAVPESPDASGTSAGTLLPRRTTSSGARDEAAEPGRSTALTRPEWTALAVVLTVSAAWITEPWHGIPPEVSALAGALLITAPRLGTTTFKAAFAEVPWSLLVFMAATTALGTALISSGAADLAARHIGGGDLQLLATVIGVSLAAHLVIQSRSARSSVLIPIVIPLAAAAGMNPAALAFASTAAAGFCHTLTSSAKPVALFADAYRPKDLLRLSAVLAPVTGLLVFAAATLLWPHLGLPLK